MPKRKIGKICLFRITGSLPSSFQVNKMRKIEAMKNLKNAAENGPTSLATTLPAIKVPPQKMAVSMSLT